MRQLMDSAAAFLISLAVEGEGGVGQDDFCGRSAPMM
jgi:hypothetical protein